MLASPEREKNIHRIAEGPAMDAGSRAREAARGFGLWSIVRRSGSLPGA
jgi:hypothetical protein